MITHSSGKVRQATTFEIFLLLYCEIFNSRTQLYTKRDQVARWLINYHDFDHWDSSSRVSCIFSSQCKCSPENHRDIFLEKALKNNLISLSFPHHHPPQLLSSLHSGRISILRFLNTPAKYCKPWLDRSPAFRHGTQQLSSDESSAPKDGGLPDHRSQICPLEVNDYAGQRLSAPFILVLNCPPQSTTPSATSNDCQVPQDSRPRTRDYGTLTRTPLDTESNSIAAHVCRFAILPEFNPLDEHTSILYSTSPTPMDWHAR
jgi:hypothetical protein